MPISQQKIADVIAGIGAAGPLLLNNNFKWAAAIVCARALDHWLDKRSAIVTTSLSEEQGNVIDFLATKFDTLCFGDRNHNSNYFGALITNEEFLKHLTNHGIKKIFIEDWPENQEPIEALESGKISVDEFMSEFSDSRGWVSENANELHKRLMANAILKGLISYRCVDTRGEEDSDDESSLWARTADRVAITIQDSARFAAKIFFPKRFTNFIGFSFYVFASHYLKSEKKMEEEDSNDTKPSQKIIEQLAPAEPCAIAYGGGHFNESSENYGVPSMRTELIKHGRNPGVISIYKSISDYRILKYLYKTEDKKIRPADVEFILNRKKRRGQIIFNEKYLEEQYLKSRSEQKLFSSSSSALAL